MSWEDTIKRLGHFAEAFSLLHAIAAHAQGDVRLPQALRNPIRLLPHRRWDDLGAFMEIEDSRGDTTTRLLVYPHEDGLMHVHVSVISRITRPNHNNMREIDLTNPDPSTVWERINRLTRKAQGDT